VTAVPLHDTDAEVTLSRPISIGVTDVARLDECPLSVLLTRGLPRTALLPSNHPFAILGTLHHALLERAQVGEAGDPPNEERLKQLWDENLALQESAALRGPDACWVPFTASMPDLERFRLRAFRVARSLEVVPWATESDAEPREQRRLGPEVAVEAVLGSLALKGKIDMVQPDGDSVRLVDYKTGQVHDDAGQVKAQYVRQLQLYAALYQRKFGVLPSGLAIADVHGREVAIESDPQDIRSAMEIATGQIESWSRSIPDGTMSAAKAQSAVPARPSREACGRCAARHLCRSHSTWLTREGAIQGGPHAGRSSNWDLAGKVEATHANTAGRSMQVRTGSTQVSLRCGESPAVKLGDFIRVYAAQAAAVPDRADTSLPTHFSTPRWARIVLDKSKGPEGPMR
jgi:RecB family exonuclease